MVPPLLLGLTFATVLVGVHGDVTVFGSMYFVKADNLTSGGPFFKVR